MRTLLVFPPASDPAHPPLGIASLAGFLRAAGEEVDLLDLNVLSYHHLLSAGSLRRAAARIERRLGELETRPALAGEEAAEYRLLAENRLGADYLGAQVPGALDALRDPATYRSREAYARASSLVRRGMELVSAAHYPVRWYPRGFSMSHLPTRSADVLAATEDRRENLFLPFFEELLDAGDGLFAGGGPELVGISINYYCQVIPGLTLAALLRRRRPAAEIVVGGGLVGFFEGRWSALAPFRGLVDAWVPYEGELPLAELVAARRRGDDLAGVAGLLRFRGAEPVWSPPGAPPDPRALPPPGFDGLPLAAYLSPEPVLPLLTSRGCYWSRCAFCSHYHLFRGRFRPKGAVQVRREMDQLARRHGCRTFYFTDEAVPPATARRLAADLASAGRPYRWFGESRFERALDDDTLGALAAGGCRMLMFGLESAVPRVLARMDKGIDPERAAAVLAACRRHGIRAFVMFFVGFPGETREEAEATLDFVEARREDVTHVAFSNFILEQHSPVHRDPRGFGIEEILPYPGEDLKIYSEYRVHEGLAAPEAIALLEEARERPGIRELIGLHLVSRTHLAFLPPRAGAAAGEAAAADRSLAAAAEPGPGRHLYPRRADDLVGRTLAFDLDEVRRRLAPSGGAARAEPVARRATSYVFSPRRETLIDVGADGLRLLAACDGSHSLDEILAALAESDRPGAIAFYRQLEARGVLGWELRP